MKNKLILYGLLAGAVYLLLKNKKKPVDVKEIEVVEEEVVEPKKEQPVAMPTQTSDPVISNIPVARPSYMSSGFNAKAYMDRYVVTPERQIISAI